MPCRNCKKQCGQGHRIAYCVCCCCNLCHHGWICPDGKHWWRKLNMHVPIKYQSRRVFKPGQSHGGLSCPSKNDR